MRDLRPIVLIFATACGGVETAPQGSQDAGSIEGGSGGSAGAIGGQGGAATGAGGAGGADAGGAVGCWYCPMECNVPSEGCWRPYLNGWECIGPEFCGDPDVSCNPGVCP